MFNAMGILLKKFPEMLINFAGISSIMGDPDSSEVVIAHDIPEVYCHKCKIKMQQTGPFSFKCPKCGLFYERKE